MNGYGGEKPGCYFHPQEEVVGVCALCLNERLLILASKQGHHAISKGTYRKTSTHSLSRIFALSSLLNRLELRYRRSENPDPDEVTSPEDSFISIKFEDNGAASWDKGMVSKVPLEQNNKEVRETKSVVEHAKQRAGLRWRKRIGQLFQLIRWKRSAKKNVCHVGSKVEGVKVRKGWIRTLTKRTSKE